MTELPRGWSRGTLGDLILRIEAGKSFYAEPRPATNDEWGIIKVSAMTWGTFQEHENKAVIPGTPFNPAHEIRPGDLLVSRANTQAYVGAPVLVGQCRPRLLLSDKSLRLIPSARADKRWMHYLLSSPRVRGHISRQATGTKESMRNISQGKLAGIPIIVPPVAEQERIAASLDAQLSRLDAVVAHLQRDLRRMAALRKRTILDAIPREFPGNWRVGTVADAGNVDLGRQRHPDWHSGNHMHPYLRVANVFEDRIDSSDLMEMDFPPDVFERFRLVKGDILLNEGQSPEFLGRPAMYTGDPPDAAFTNSLLRFRVHPDVLPEWALLVFRHHMHSGRFTREARITTNIAHLSAGRFKTVEFPIPPIGIQECIVAEVDSRLVSVEWLRKTLSNSLAKTLAARRALLNDEVEGGLDLRNVTNESPIDLLESIEEKGAAVSQAAEHEPRRAVNL